MMILLYFKFTLTLVFTICPTVICTGHWSWNVVNAFGTTTTRFVLYAIPIFPRGQITWKRAFVGVTIVEQLHTKTRRRCKPISSPLLKRRTKMKINQFLSLTNRLVFDSFSHCFLTKFVKRCPVSGFIASNYKSRVSIDPC